ncbi:MAG: hypothetical protein AUH29_04140 [Candidatus Rokubacteria bacterium 13_1_40CM_69_27]|nr:MAG: hypothetical protein AUH29_04140 [Candidatus Rokubacteria bacterium 13_1_40CM_69_27]OLC34309.1 MAG: hypothetical protein AUH81_12630 [Candidatus Rokubacteria bacterium 13_1_40CM_4_69_5]
MEIEFVARNISSPKRLAGALKPGTVRGMVPAGEATESVIRELAELLQRGDRVVDCSDTIGGHAVRR